MKKTAKSIVLALVMGILLIALTGCGANKLVATKSSDDEFMGKYEEKIEISFKDDKAYQIVWTMEFEDEDKAESVASIFKLANSSDEDTKIDVEQNGKKVTLKMDAKSFASQEDIDDNSLSKEEMKKSLEDEGYTVK